MILKILKLYSPKGSFNFENFQNHSYLLIKNCTRGRAISYTKSSTFKIVLCMEAVNKTMDHSDIYRCAATQTRPSIYCRFLSLTICSGISFVKYISLPTLHFHITILTKCLNEHRTSLRYINPGRVRIKTSKSRNKSKVIPSNELVSQTTRRKKVTRIFSLDKKGETTTDYKTYFAILQTQFNEYCHIKDNCQSRLEYTRTTSLHV